MRISSVHLKNQEKYSQKLKLLDQHLIRESTGKQSNINTDQIMKMVALKLSAEPAQQIFLSTPKVILFNNIGPRNFFVGEVEERKGKKYILSVNTHIFVKVGVSVNETKIKRYSFQGNKAIIIHQQPWKRLNVSFQIQKVGPFSSVRISIQQIQIQHKNPKGSSIKLRPNINLELQQYLKDVKGKTGEIIRARSMTRLKSQVSRRKNHSTVHSKFRNTVRHSQMVKTKSELFQFQKKKQFYIRHLERMSPSKVQKLKSEQNDYGHIKCKHMQYLAKIIVMTKIGKFISEESAKIRYKKAQQIKISMLCMDFVKIIKNKFKLKMTEKARHRMTNLHYFHHMPPLIYQGCLKRARQTLRQSLIPYMDFRGLQELCQNSVQYLEGIKIIQRFIRRRRFIFYDRIKIICDKLCYIYQIQMNESKRIEIAEKYFRWSQSQNKLRFKIFKDKLLQIIREND